MRLTRGRGETWALALAAGSGTRLSGLTRLGNGPSVPKQFCSLAGGPSLLQDALSRAARIVPPERTIAVVASEHRLWWRDELAALPEENVIAQPLNRGTAAGVLLPLLEILRRDPDATVVMLPSDHFVADETVMELAIRRGLDEVRRDPEGIVLLGIEPDSPDSEYGWIVPGGEATDGSFRVRAFVEKPRADFAAELMERGGVWNSFLLVAKGPALKALYLRRRPSLLHALAFAPRRADGSLDPAALARLYASIPSADFSRELLQGSEERLRLVTVPFCGWSDLGTPDRLAECVRRWPKPTPIAAAMRHPVAPVTLAAAVGAA
jgi:mannose-1-phosphate guanylyltransferase